MPCIVTVTLNPSLDNSTTTPRIYPDGKLRCSKPSYEPGGGGINAARAIHKLGGQAIALFPAGGPTGRHLDGLLKAEGVETIAIAIDDWTRECINLVEDSSGEQYRFIMPGANLTADEQEHVVQALEKLPALDYVVISGSLPDSINPEFIVRLLKCAKTRNAFTVIDTSGKPLRLALAEGGIGLIKPNLNELAALAGIDIVEPGQVASVARSLIESGKTEAVLVSLGPQGALLVTATDEEQIVPPAVKKNSTVGAGDSLVGAVTLKLSQGASLREAARYGVAAGTAATLNHGTELCKKSDTDRLFDWICKQQPTA